MTPSSPPSSTASAPSSQLQWTDERVESAVSVLLRVGVFIAAALTTLGGILYLVHHASMPVSYTTFGAVPESLRSLTGIGTEVRTLTSDALIQLGVVLLIATPIARVAFSLFGFLKQRDRTYMVVTAIVLAILVLSLSGYVALH
jgi:uncharacterized membrane protein